MPIEFVNVGGTFEAAWDGWSCVILRQNTFPRQRHPSSLGDSGVKCIGPNFHLPPYLLCRLLELVPKPVATPGSIVSADPQTQE